MAEPSPAARIAFLIHAGRPMAPLGTFLMVRAVGADEPE
jgi:hypothetical protein